MTSDKQLNSWKKANPWILQNTQNGLAACGRFPNKEAAIAAANERGGVTSIEGHVVYFSEMPSL